MAKKKFKNRKFGKFLGKMIEKPLIRAAVKSLLPGIGGPLVETIKNATHSPAEEDPNKKPHD